MDGKTAALVFPIINDILVIPAIHFDVKGGGAAPPYMTNIMGFDATMFSNAGCTITTPAPAASRRQAASPTTSGEPQRENAALAIRCQCQVQTLVYLRSSTG
jgi:hypothetical protein